MRVKKQENNLHGLLYFTTYILAHFLNYLYLYLTRENSSQICNFLIIFVDVEHLNWSYGIPLATTMFSDPKN